MGKMVEVSFFFHVKFEWNERGYFFVGKQSIGRNGEHLYVRVPLGTIVSEYHHEHSSSSSSSAESYAEFDAFIRGQVDFNFDDDENLFDDDNDLKSSSSSSSKSAKSSDPSSSSKKKEIHLDRDKEIVLVAEGGQAGIGNAALAGSKHRQRSLVSFP